MPLTDAKVKNAKGKKKPYKLHDKDGLYMLVLPVGGRYWRFDYRFGNEERKDKKGQVIRGKRKTLALGTYPEISLLKARSSHLQARQALADGIDPGQQKKTRKQAQDEISNNFEAVAREWYKKYLPTWNSRHAATVIGRLVNDVFPFLGQQPINEITSPDVLRILRRVESRGVLETAHRIKGVCGQVFRYAIATGRITRDPAADLKGALPPTKEKHRAAITDPNKLADLLRAIDSYQGSFVVKCALQLQALTFVRPGELRHAEWQEIDLDGAQWNIPGEKMKLKLPHVVPLSEQTIIILKALQLVTGHGRYVLPNGRTISRPLSENAVLAALGYIGFGKDEVTGVHIMTGHGFRAAARTMLDEVLQQRVDLIEHQLAHAVKDPNGRAYNRTAHLPARRVMMQLWADYLDGLKAGAKVVPLVKAK